MTEKPRKGAEAYSLHRRMREFEFDRVFGDEVETPQLYDELLSEHVSSAIDGYHLTVFCYGQTAAGKTHTMLGDAGRPGILPLAVHDLFERMLDACSQGTSFLARCTYFEVADFDSDVTLSDL